eukprot:TRINITY_DN41802_c0_g1_i2.p1 TRINITY_DN41802_c0_g1~~TRINITY_DN41802_c0_g1_i2.p1  ORF type:complete len:390 (-),score=30.75 TRINITY_DN41802_c0_g1_i2:241-1410(-)
MTSPQEAEANPIPMTPQQLALLLEDIAKLDTQRVILEPGVMLSDTGMVLNLNVIRSKAQSSAYSLPDMLNDLNSICEPFMNQSPAHAQYAKDFLEQANDAIVNGVRDAQLATYQSDGNAAATNQVQNYGNMQQPQQQPMQQQPYMQPQQQYAHPQHQYSQPQQQYAQQPQQYGQPYASDNQGFAGQGGDAWYGNGPTGPSSGLNGGSQYQQNGMAGGMGYHPQTVNHSTLMAGASQGVLPQAQSTPQPSKKKSKADKLPNLGPNTPSPISAAPRSRLEGRRCEVCAVIKKAGCGTENAHFRCLKRKRPEGAQELERRVRELVDIGQEERVTVWNPKEGRKLSGQAAPMLKNLVGWLASHPGWEAQPRTTTSPSRNVETAPAGAPTPAAA